MSDFVLPEYTVYFETSAAFSPKPNEPISGGFLAALSQIRRLTNIVAKVPSVVTQELCYQKTQAALQAAENQQRNAQTITQISGIAPPTFVSCLMSFKEELEVFLKKHGMEYVERDLE